MIVTLINGWQRLDSGPNPGSIASPRPLLSATSSLVWDGRRVQVLCLHAAATSCPSRCPVCVLRLLPGSSDVVLVVFLRFGGCDGTSAASREQKDFLRREDWQSRPQAFPLLLFGDQDQAWVRAHCPGFKAGVGVGVIRPVRAQQPAPVLLEAASRGSRGPVRPA